MIGLFACGNWGVLWGLSGCCESVLNWGNSRCRRVIVDLK